MRREHAPPGKPTFVHHDALGDLRQERPVDRPRGPVVVLSRDPDPRNPPAAEPIEHRHDERPPDTPSAVRRRDPELVDPGLHVFVRVQILVGRAHPNDHTALHRDGQVMLGMHKKPAQHLGPDRAVEHPAGDATEQPLVADPSQNDPDPGREISHAGDTPLS